MSDDNGEMESKKTTDSTASTTLEANPAAEVIPELEAKPASSWLGRVLWLGPRVAEAREKTFGPSQPGFVWYDVARQICDDVVKIGETGKGSWAVLLLDANAVELLTRAHLSRAGIPIGNGPLGEADWANARKVSAVETAWSKLTTAQDATLTAMLGPDRDATIAKLSGEERDEFATGLHDLVMRMAEPLEVESNRLGRALFARWSRLVVVVAALALVVGFTGKWASKKFGRPNIALHAAVTTSSQFPGQGLDHTLLVDGDPDTLGFHTQEGGQQWAVIDLGKVQKFDKIVVYNRADGFEERAVPIKIEVGNDNVTYHQVAERKEVFDKWTVKGLHAEARYVRLKNTPPNYFHLGEVEIY
jgi:hypothetical protein